jgi:hypothetical protein
MVFRIQQGKLPVGALKEKVPPAFRAQRESGGEVVGEHGSYVLREPPAPYSSILGYENDALRPENAYFWDRNL